MRPIILGLVALFCWGCQQPEARATNVALVYGITLYDQAMAPGVGPNLLYPASDATTVARLLSTHENGTFDEVTVRTDADATKDQLTADVHQTAQGLTPESVFLFYYGGHSQQGLVGGAGIDGHAYLLPYGAYSTRTTPRISPDAAITEDELADLFSALPTKKVIVILDGCYTAGFFPDDSPLPQDAQSYYRDLWKAFLQGKAPGMDQDLDRWLGTAGAARQEAVRSWEQALARRSGLGAPGTLVLAAAGALELSWDDDSYGMGVFTSFFVGSQRGGDADGDGLVTVSEAYRYAFDHIQRRWNGLTEGAASGGLVSGTNAFLPHLSETSVDYVLFQK